MKRLTLNRETLLSLSDHQTMDVAGGMRPGDSVRKTVGTDCVDASVSICLTNCGCKWTN